MNFLLHVSLLGNEKKIEGRERGELLGSNKKITKDKHDIFIY